MTPDSSISLRVATWWLERRACGALLQLMFKSFGVMTDESKFDVALKFGMFSDTLTEVRDGPRVLTG